MKSSTMDRFSAHGAGGYSPFIRAAAVSLMFLTAIGPASPSGRAFRFESLTAKDGLSSNHITCIYQDHLGYLWIGTVDGLNRYDGEEVLNWYHHPLDSSSIYCNSITCIFEDREHRFWVATQHAVNRMDRSTGRFERFDVPGVQTICQDSSGVVWAGAYTQGLYFFRAQQNRWERYQPQRAFGGALDNDYIYRMAASRGKIWLATTNHGVKVLDLVSGVYGYPGSRDASGGVQDLCLDAPDQIWLASTSAGLQLLETRLQNFRSWRHVADARNTPASDRMSALVRDREGYLWLGYETDGLDRFDPRTGRFEHFRHESGDPFSLQDETILVLYCDESGIIWAGTKYGGVQKIDYAAIRFYPGRIAGLAAEEKIWCFSSGAGRQLWLGAESGAYLIDWVSKRIIHQLKTPYPVRAIIPDSHHGIWLATLGDGLYCWQPSTNRVTIYRHELQRANFLSCNYLYALIRDARGLLWIASHGGGLESFNPETGLFRQYPFSSFAHDPKSDQWALCLLEDGEDGLWIGAWEFGVLHFDKRHGAYTVLAERWPALQNATILSLYQTREGILWAGSHGSGLYRIDVARDSCQLYTDAAGLPNNVIYGIAADSAGTLWLTTNKGMASLEPVTRFVKEYTPEDGLLSQEFNLGALICTPDGQIFAGGASGFNYFTPVHSSVRRPPRAVITGLIVNGRKADSAAFEPGGRLRLRYDENPLSIRYTALPFSRTAEHHFAYRLAGLDEEWKNAEGSRQVDFFSIPPGRYRFAVKAVNREGIWSDDNAELEIVVIPPIWQRWYFFCILALALGLAGWQIYHVRIRRLLEVNHIRIHERELVRERVAADFHDQLGHRLTKISMLSKRLIKNGDGGEPGNHSALQKIAENADASIKEMRQLVWELDPRKDTLLDLMTHLKNYSDDVFDETEIAFVLDGLAPEWNLIRLPMDLRRQAAAIFQEGMHNILKHARGCRHVTLGAVIVKGTLHLILADDGSGFHANSSPNGRGLQSMHSRAAKAGGTLQVESGTSGARLHFQVKLDPGLVDF